MYSGKTKRSKNAPAEKTEEVVKRAVAGSEQNIFMMAVTSKGVTRTLQLNGKTYQDGMKPCKVGFKGPRGIGDHPDIKKAMDEFGSDELFYALQELDGTDLSETLRQLEEE